eukprot:XP_001704307.1 Hypothetical protein GL50803_31668 [Giardia lamblia ATCC 50803]
MSTLEGCKNPDAIVSIVLNSNEESAAPFVWKYARLARGKDSDCIRVVGGRSIHERCPSTAAYLARLFVEELGYHAKLALLCRLHQWGQTHFIRWRNPMTFSAACKINGRFTEGLRRCTGSSQRDNAA